MSERAALFARAIPFMQLSNGTDTSLTAPPPPLPHYLNAEGRAMARFAVEGNAVSMYNQLLLTMLRGSWFPYLRSLEYKAGRLTS